MIEIVCNRVIRVYIANKFNSKYGAESQGLPGFGAEIQFKHITTNKSRRKISLLPLPTRLAVDDGELVGWVY